MLFNEDRLLNPSKLVVLYYLERQVLAMSCFLYKNAFESQREKALKAVHNHILLSWKCISCVVFSLQFFFCWNKRYKISCGSNFWLPAFGPEMPRHTFLCNKWRPWWWFPFCGSIFLIHLSLICHDSWFCYQPLIVQYILTVWMQKLFCLQSLHICSL